MNLRAYVARLFPYLAVREFGGWDDAHHHALYRMYNEAAHLVYVGVTKQSVKSRLVEHRKRTWWPLVTRLEVTYGYTEAEAHDCEYASIRGEEPLFNVQGYPGDGMRYADFSTRVATRKAGLAS